MFAWLRPVCIRLRAVGCLLKNSSSRWVGSLDRLISSRTIEIRDPLLELEIELPAVAERERVLLGSLVGWAG